MSKSFPLAINSKFWEGYTLKVQLSMSGPVGNGFTHGLNKYVYIQLWETCCADISNNSLTAQGYDSLTSD